MGVGSRRQRFSCRAFVSRRQRPSDEAADRTGKASRFLRPDIASPLRGIRLGEQLLRETLEVQGNPTVVSSKLDRQIAEAPSDAVDEREGYVAQKVACEDLLGTRSALPDT